MVESSAADDPSENANHSTDVGAIDIFAAADPLRTHRADDLGPFIVAFRTTIEAATLDSDAGRSSSSST